MMPTDDVSDLRDVVDAINRLCETMKTSDYDDSDNNNDVGLCEDADVEVKVESEVGLVSPEQIVVSEVETYVAELWSDAAALQAEGVDAVEDVSSQIDNVSTLTLDSHLIEQRGLSAVVDVSSNRERNVDTVVWDSSATQVEILQIADTRIEGLVPVTDSVAFDPEPITASFEPLSEMYYTASSEVSLLSDVELPDRVQDETMEGRETLTRDDRNGVMAGHVAAMRERFESMTRANTPCPDVMRSVSPSIDVYRNITPSPDHLG